LGQAYDARIQMYGRATGNADGSATGLLERSPRDSNGLASYSCFALD
jgi:hypothetical protein